MWRQHVLETESVKLHTGEREHTVTESGNGMDLVIVYFSVLNQDMPKP